MKTLAMQIAVTAGLAGVLALTGASLSFAQIRVLALLGAGLFDPSWPVLNLGVAYFDLKK